MKRLLGLFVGLFLMVFATSIFAFDYDAIELPPGFLGTYRLNNNNTVVYTYRNSITWQQQIEIWRNGISEIVAVTKDTVVDLSDNDEILVFSSDSGIFTIATWEYIENVGWQKNIIKANVTYYPRAMSDDGETILCYDSITGTAYVLINDVEHALPKDGSYSIYPYSVNNSSEAIGRTFPTSLAVIWRNVTELAYLFDLGGPYYNQYPYDINNLGQIAGFYRDENRIDHAFIWENSIAIDLGTLGCPVGGSRACCINDSGHVIGYSDSALCIKQEFLYKDGIMYEINKLVDPSVIKRIMKADDINNKDVILTQSREPSGLIKGYLLVPANNPPEANAGLDIDIFSEEQLIIVIEGTAIDIDGDDLIYRWSKNGIDITGWLLVGINGEAYLDIISTSTLFDVGTYILTLEVNDGKEIVTDEMVLIIHNSSPYAFPIGAGVYEVSTPVILAGSVSDFDGDFLTYEWLEGTQILFFGEILSIYQGIPVEIDPYEISTLNIGTHNLILRVNDGVNPSVETDIVVEIIDTGDPTLSPVASDYMLWPPNHKMVDIFIKVNASDNSGEPVILSAIVTSNEPQDGLGDGDMSPDWTELVIDQENGIIIFQLRAERSGLGDGRIYTISITATDISGNSSTASLEIIVPHDRRH